MADRLALLSFGRRRLPVVLQSEAAECGLACLAMVLGYYGHVTSLSVLRRRYAVSLKGCTLRQLIDIADTLDLSSRPVRLELDALRYLRTPAILHWNMNHFVVLRRAGRTHVTIVDPALGKRRMPIADLDASFTGVALELVPSPAFKPKVETEPMRISFLWEKIYGLWGALSQTFILSMVLQFLILLAPFYLQLAIDEVVLRGDLDFLTVLAIAFAMVVLLQALTEVVRSLSNIYITSQLGFQMTVNVFHHLVRLPLEFFGRRHMGDIVSRFSSIQAINTILSQGVILMLIDGIMALSFIAIILIYSVQLALAVFLFIALYFALRFSLYWPTRLREDEALVTSAAEQSIFMETVRALQAIKLFGNEAERQQLWSNALAATVNARARVRFMQIWRSFIDITVMGMSHVVVVFLAVQLVVEGAFTLGMLFAFLAYKTLLEARAVGFIEQLFQFQMIALHLARLGDIVHTEVEATHDGQDGRRSVELAGRIEFVDLCYRYTATDALVLDTVSFEIQPGEFLAITGRSGCGKTTLLKIAAGLMQPTSGEVIVDGIRLRDFELSAYRRQIAAVMQEDFLLSGSIADNVAFFDPALDMDWVRACCRTASLHDDIETMPMGYASLVGDMGTSLSGGQKQRLMLARALYRKPRILFLDEGSSHLDPATEVEINARLKAMQITRVAVAHRIETIRAADRIVDLSRHPIIVRPNAIEPTDVVDRRSPLSRPGLTEPSHADP